MNIRKMNLNLLLALDALLHEQNVTQAAKKIYVTQAAMSNSLKRLRALLSDQLLVRVGRQMRLTSKALYLKPRIAAILKEIAMTLDTEEKFNPKTSSRHFHLTMSNHFAHFTSQKVFSKIFEHAPNIIVTILSVDAYLPINFLTTNECDLFIAPKAYIPSDFCSQPLFYDYMVCVGARNTPVLQKKLTVKSFLAAGHIKLETRREPIKGLSKEVVQIMANRNIKLYTPYISIALSTLARTNMLTTIPASLASELDSRFIVQALPFEMPHILICQAWPKQLTDSAAHQWFRSLMASVGVPCLKL